MASEIDQRMQPKAKLYNVIRRAVEEGASHGVMRSQKHRDNPLTPEERAALVEEVINGVMNELSEVIDYGD